MLQCIACFFVYTEQSNVTLVLDFALRYLYLESAMPKSVMMQLRNGASGIIPDGPSKTRVKNHVIASGLDCAKAVSKKSKIIKTAA